jgi:hypothetical protein
MGLSFILAMGGGGFFSIICFHGFKKILFSSSVFHHLFRSGNINLLIAT